MKSLPQRWWLLGVLVGLFALALLAAKLIPSGHQRAEAKPQPAQRTLLRWSPCCSRWLSPLDTPEPTPGPHYNTTGCVWNDEDENMWTAYGDADTSAQMFTLCIIADFDDSQSGVYPKRAYLKVETSKPTLDVTVRSDCRGYTYTGCGIIWAATPVAAGHRTVYTLCISDPVADNFNLPLADLPEVAGSDGARGVPVDYTLSIAATGTVAHNISVWYEVGFTGATGLQPFIVDQQPDITCAPNDGR